jgi:hypothetical protein
MNTKTEQRCAGERREACPNHRIINQAASLGMSCSQNSKAPLRFTTISFRVKNPAGADRRAIFEHPINRVRRVAEITRAAQAS